MRKFFHKYKNGQALAKNAKNYITKTRFILKEELGTEPEVIFDIGANVGIWSYWFLDRFPDATVFSFEPVPKTYADLKENLKDKIPGQSIKTYKIGFGEKAGKIRLGKPVERQENSGLYSKYYSDKCVNKDGLTGGSDVVECRFENINDFCFQNGVRPDLIKLDVEGCEHEIVRSLSPELLESVQAFIVEVNRNSSFPEPRLVSEYLVEKGFWSPHPHKRTTGDYAWSYGNGRNLLSVTGTPANRAKSYDRLWIRKKEEKK